MDIRQLILPAAVGLTHLEVYKETSPDGQIGGSPHLHMVCSEMYYVLSGTGQVELLSAEGYHKADLIPGKVVFFRPGVVHRLLNPNKNLNILVIMQNGGLPERGDFTFPFEESVFASELTYANAVRVASHEDAIARRDLAVKGFVPLRDAMVKDRTKGVEALRAFYERARRVIAPKVDGFEWVLKSGAQAETKYSLDAIDFIRMGHTEYLEKARYAEIYPMNDAPKNGMCGTLHPYALSETFLAEGKKVA